MAYNKPIKQENLQLAVFAALNILANNKFPLIGALVGSEVSLMKFILVFILTTISTVGFTKDSQSIVGSWIYTNQMPTYTDIKQCDFSLDGNLFCVIKESGCSKGFCDAHEYKTKGNWVLSDNKLILTENVFEKRIKQHYTISEIHKKTLVLITSNNIKEVWQKAN